MDKFEIAKGRISIDEILQNFGIQINRGGFIHCPSHNETNPSCKVYKRNVKCFSCGFNGSVIDITMAVIKCDKKEALAYLDNAFKLGLETPLTDEQKKEWGKTQRKKEEERGRNERLKSFERKTLTTIAKKLHKGEDWVETHKWEQHNDREEWGNKVADSYFKCLKQTMWLKWLYDAICEFAHTECEFDYTIGNDRVQILRDIYSGKIKI